MMSEKVFRFLDVAYFKLKLVNINLKQYLFLQSSLVMA